MDISCDIIRDLLPLYAEELVSEDSKKLVEGHLCGCEPCTKQLGILKKAAALPIEVETKSLKRVENTIRKRRVLTVIAVMLTMVSLVVSGFVFMLTPVFLSAEEAIEGVELREDGGLAIDYAPGITGRSSFALDEAILHRGIMCHTTRYDWLKGKRQQEQLDNLSREALEAYILEKYEADEMTPRLWDRFHNISVEYGTWTSLDGTFLHVYDPETWIEGNGSWTSKESEVSQWYMDVQTGATETLLWDGAGQSVEGSWIQPFYGYGIIFIVGAVMAVVLFFLSRKANDRKRGLLIRLAIVGIGVAFSVLFVTGGTLSVGEVWAFEWKDAVVIESVSTIATLQAWYQLHCMKKQNRGL